MTPLQRILRRVRFDDSGCWTWTGAASGGYGRIGIDGKAQLTHRVVYQACVGPIPDGLELDHLCRNRLCCSPEHLEAVTRQVNHLRTLPFRQPSKRPLKPHCAHGHLYTPETTSWWRSARSCKTCKTIARQNIDKAAALLLPEEMHGIYATYVKRGCRCRRCTDEATRRVNENKRKRAERRDLEMAS